MVKHLLKLLYFKHFFIIFVSSKRQTCRFKSSLHVFVSVPDDRTHPELDTETLGLKAVIHLLLDSWATNIASSVNILSVEIIKWPPLAPGGAFKCLRSIVGLFKLL